MNSLGMPGVHSSICHTYLKNVFCLLEETIFVKRADLDYSITMTVVDC